MHPVAAEERAASAQFRLVCLSLIVLLSCFRLAHIHLLWADEDYHVAAALQVLHGKIPYRDFWYDKPPLSAFYYLLIGAHSGWPLRLLDAGYILLACRIIFCLASSLWTKREGWAAALLLAFYTTFYLPSAVIPFAADALMLVPHLAAIYFATARRALWAGVWTGVALLANPKAVFVLLACAAWLWPALVGLVAGFVAVTALAIVVGLASGAWPGYIEQVWQWGLIYAKDSPVTHPLANAVLRTADWAGFHLALVAFACFGFWWISQSLKLKLLAWIALSFAAVALGSRFAPHYFLQLLPALAVPAARGLIVAVDKWRTRAIAILALLLIVPIVRFGPHYAALALDNVMGREPRWSDVAMDLDSRHVAGDLKALAKPGETLFVWGYRP
ncbi:MAG: hypothetical protein JO108_20460, partial [Acidobacteriaceae bacterium]|nr:hypothetical protein [Acidobacteriaceae bacterium]